MSRRPEDQGQWRYTLFGDRSRPVVFDGWIFERRARLGQLEDAFNQYVGGGFAKTIWFWIDGALELEFHSLEPDRPLSPLTYRPPLTLLPAEFRVGQRWQWRGECNRNPTEIDMTVVSVENVSTPIGERQAVLVRESREGVTVDRWLARDLGLLRTARNGVAALQLVSWQPGGSQEERGGGR